MLKMNGDHAIVAMSGGVDSSLAAYLLKEQGYRVTGIMLNLWSNRNCQGENACCTPEAQRNAKAVADQLDIPFYVIDAKNQFYREVIQYFMQSHKDGDTPNPCWVCNVKVKWKVLLDQLDLLGAKWLATGHYARLAHQDGSTIRLLQAKDIRKDQSYVLSGLNQAQLSRTIFPLGELTKSEVRQKAQELSLATADKPDSQDLCFLGDQNVEEFLVGINADSGKSGEIVDLLGNVLGTHLGLPSYTIGQRKGIRVSDGFPYYVLEKDLERNRLIIGKKENLGKDRFTVTHVNWISGYEQELPLEVQVKIRYKTAKVNASISKINGDTIQVKSMSILRDITPGQIAVFYQSEEVLGSGIIRTN